jgi:hypothetical protein
MTRRQLVQGSGSRIDFYLEQSCTLLERRPRMLEGCG